MNRTLSMAPGADLTSDLAVMRVLQAEAANSTLMFDSKNKLWDLTEYPSQASNTALSLATLLSVDIAPPNNTLSASNCIYRINDINRKYPCIIVSDSTVVQSNMSNIQNEYVNVWIFDEEQSGIESIIRISKLISALLNNNVIPSDNMGFLFGCLVHESAIKNIVDYGWAKSLSYRYTVSILGDSS